MGKVHKTFANYSLSNYYAVTAVSLLSSRVWNKHEQEGKGEGGRATHQVLNVAVDVLLHA